MECPICKHDKHDSLKDDGKFAVFRCNSCATIFSNFVYESNNGRNVTSDAHLNDYVKISPTSIPSYFINRYVSKLVAEFDYKYLENHIKIESIRNALDIGSKYGYLVKKLSDVGINTHGIEAVKYPYSVANDKISYQYFTESYDSKDKKYDLIIMGDILHVMPNSLDVLKKAIQMLDNNGHVLITSFNPNSDIINEIIERHGIGSILYLSKKGYEKICIENNCNLIDFTCYVPKIFVIKISLMNKINTCISIIKTLMGLDSGFEENVKGIRSSALIKKIN